MTKLSKFVILLLVSIVILFKPILITTNRIAGNYGDIYLHYYPLKYLVSEQIIKGNLPLWNPYIFAGQPLLANPQSAVFYPFSLFFCIFPLPIAFNYFIVVHFLLAGLFFYCFMVSSKMSRTASIMGSMAYTFSSFLIYRVAAGHPAALSGYIWLPLILLGLNKLGESNQKIWTISFALTLLLQFLSGHTFPFYITCVLIFFHLISQRLSYWKSLVYSMALFVLLACIQLIPSLELSRAAETSNWMPLVQSYSMPLKNYINLLLPNYFGNIRDGSYIFQQNPSFFIERHSVYFGFLPFLFSLYGLYFALTHRKYFYPILVIAGIVLSLGFYTPVYKALYDIIPGMGFLRVPSRFYLLSLVALIFLSSLFWSHFISRMTNKIKIALILLIFVDLFIWGTKFIYSEDISSYRKKNEIASLINPLYRIITEPDIINANKAMLYHQFNINGYEAIMLKDFSRYLGLQEKKVLNSTGLARSNLYSPLSKGLSAGYIVTPNITPENKLIVSMPNGLKVYSFPDALPRLFLAKRVKLFREFMFDVNNQTNYLKQTKFSPDEELLLDYLPGDIDKIGSEGNLFSFSCEPNRLLAEISLKKQGVVVFSEIFYPGWRAWAKQTEIKVMRGNKALRALPLSAGEYIGKDKIFMYFSPVSFMFGLYISVTTLIVIAALLYLHALKLENNIIYWVNRIFGGFLNK